MPGKLSFRALRHRESPGRGSLWRRELGYWRERAIFDQIHRLKLGRVPAAW
jgi:hypothetical protein